jgi:hypothetical protein
MLDRPPREREWLSWLYVVLWAFVIFLTVPFARDLIDFVKNTWGLEVLNADTSSRYESPVSGLLITKFSSRQLVWLSLGVLIGGILANGRKAEAAWGAAMLEGAPIEASTDLATPPSAE